MHLLYVYIILNFNCSVFFQALDYKLDRNECLDLKGEILGPSTCETLEEILKRLQFVTINLEGTNIDDEVGI